MKRIILMLALVAGFLSSYSQTYTPIGWAGSGATVGGEKRVKFNMGSFGIYNLTDSLKKYSTKVFASNGLTKFGDTLKFGGSLQNTTSLNLNEKDLIIANTGSFEKSFAILTSSIASIGFNGIANSANFTAIDDKVSIGRGAFQSLSISPEGFILADRPDNNPGKGINYRGVDFDNFEDSTLVTKKFVVDLIASSGGTPDSTEFRTVANSKSLAQLQTAANLKVDKTTTVNSKSLSSNIVLDKTDIGLSNVDNTSDINKPISTLTQAALNLKQNSFSGLTTNYLSKASSASTIANSQIFDDGTYVGIGTNTPTFPFEVVRNGVNGIARFAGNGAAVSFFLENTATNGKKYSFGSEDNGNYFVYDETAGRYIIKSETNGKLTLGIVAQPLVVPSLTASQAVLTNVNKELISVPVNGASGSIQRTDGNLTIPSSSSIIRVGAHALTQTTTAATNATFPAGNGTLVYTTAVTAAANVVTLSKSASYTIVSGDFGTSGHLILFVNATSAAVTITLPSLAIAATKQITVFKTDASANVVTISGAANINSAATYTLPSINNSVDIYSNTTIYYAK